MYLQQYFYNCNNSDDRFGAITFFLKWQLKMRIEIIVWVWGQLQQMSNGDKNYFINIWFFNSIFTLDVAIEGNTLKWSIYT
jgi:hypothetical protein